MADKINAIKIKQPNGSYSDQIPISVLIQNVQWDQDHSLLDVLGSVDLSSSGKGNLQHQIDELDENKISHDDFNSQLDEFLSQQIREDTESWLEENVNTGQTIGLTTNLTISGLAADAKAVGDAIDAKTFPIDNALSDSSTNPVQNKVVASAISELNGALSNDVDDLKSGLSEVVESSIDELDSAEFVNLSGYYIGGAEPHNIATSANVSMMYVPCDSNTKYEVDKIQSKRFQVAYTKETPANGVLTYGWIRNDSATSITITTGGDALFLCVYYKHSSDTLTENEIYNSIHIYKKVVSVNVVRFDEAQSLTEQEKAQARTNIGVAESGLSIIPANQKVFTGYYQVAGNASQVITQNKIFDISGSLVTYGGMGCKKHPVVGGESYQFINAFENDDENVPVYVVVDSNENVIEYSYSYDADYDALYEMYIHKMPSNAAFIYRNSLSGNLNSMNLTLLNVIYTTEHISLEDITQDIVKSKYTISDEQDIVEHKGDIVEKNQVYRGSGIRWALDATTCYIDTINYCALTKYTLEPGKKYLLRYCHYYTYAIPAYVICDNNNTVLYGDHGDGNGKDLFDIPIEVTQSSILYVNCPNAKYADVILEESEKDIRKYTLREYIFEATGENSNVMAYGAYADGLHDDIEAIKSAISANTGGTVYFPVGTYAISEPIKTNSHVDNNVNLIFEKGAKVIPLNTMDYLLDYGGDVTDTTILKTRKVYICGAIFDASNIKLNIAAVHISSYVCNAVVSDCTIKTKETDGLILGETNHPVPTDAYITNVLIRNSSNANNNGLVLNGTDNNITNVRVYAYKINILCNASAQFFTGIHTLCGSSGNDVSIYVKANSQVTLATYYADSEETFVKAETNCVVILTNCYYYSYKTNKTTMFDLDTGTKLRISGLYIRCKSGNEHIGVITPYSAFATIVDKSALSVAGLVVDGAQYMRDGDILKGMGSSDNSLTFKDTTLTTGTWYHLGSIAIDDTVWKRFEFVCSGRNTEIPLNIKCSSSGTLSADIGSAKVLTDDDATYQVGFTLHNSDFASASDYPRVDVYIKKTTSNSRIMEYFKVVSKCNIPISTHSASLGTLLASSNSTPALTFTVNCANGTIAQD